VAVFPPPQGTAGAAAAPVGFAARPCLRAGAPSAARRLAGPRSAEQPVPRRLPEGVGRQGVGAFPHSDHWQRHRRVGGDAPPRAQAPLPRLVRELGVECGHEPAGEAQVWVGVPTAALVPSATAAALAGSKLLDMLTGLSELPWLIGSLLAICAAAVAALGAVAWLAAAAETMGQLWRRLGCALAAGALLLFGAEAMPVHLASDGARIAGGASIGGSIVRVEHLWPRNPDRLHILRGTGPVRRGQVLELRGGQPERWLQGTLPRVPQRAPSPVTGAPVPVPMSAEPVQPPQVRRASSRHTTPFTMRFAGPSGEQSPAVSPRCATAGDRTAPAPNERKVAVGLFAAKPAATHQSHRPVSPSEGADAPQWGAPTTAQLRFCSVTIRLPCSAAEPKLGPP
jgi:hypothetical protein